MQSPDPYRPKGRFFFEIFLFLPRRSARVRHSDRTSEGVRTNKGRQAGVRCGNNANNSNLSARYLNANNTVANTNAYYCASAKV
jgi:hypothetical protein